MFSLIKKSEIVVDVEFRGSKFSRKEEVYTYESNDGARLTFHADPNKEWNWVVVQQDTNMMGIKNSSKIIKHHLATI